ncbi:MAG: hypothetical protein H5T61_04810 [Thermoflexales bacterium]|nr:hypothetical protein [Thermoflexales bacterium]
MQVANQRGLEYAIRYAERLSTDPTMRPAIQRANQRISQAVKAKISLLQRYRPDEQRIVLGYVAWWLRVLESSQQSGNPRLQRRRR